MRSKSRYKVFRDVALALADAAETTDLSFEPLVDFFSGTLDGHEQAFRDTYQACLGRLPEAAFATRAYASRAEAASHIVASLSCPEFVRNVPALLAAAFPEAPRIFFVHIPKTGGSLIKASLRAGGYSGWDISFQDPFWLAEEGGTAFLLKMIGRQARQPHTPIFLAGHAALRDFPHLELVRASDHVFTVIRNPADIMLSWMNYTMMVAVDRPDRKDGSLFVSWLESAGYTAPTRDEEATAAMFGALLRQPDLILERADILTRYLSMDGSARSAIDNIKRLNMDVVDITALGTYLENDLQLMPVEDRANMSRAFLGGMDDLPWEDRLQAQTTMMSRDTSLYAALRDLMGPDDVLRPMRDLR